MGRAGNKGCALALFQLVLAQLFYPTTPQGILRLIRKRGSELDLCFVVVWEAIICKWVEQEREGASE